MENKKAIITGINGQDGSYLAELLLNKGYEVHGIVRRHSVAEAQTWRLNKAGIFGHSNLYLHYGDVLDMGSLISVFKKVKPNEVYHLAAQSHVKISFDEPQYTTDSIVTGAINILECMRNFSPKARLYMAGSSEMYGNEYDNDGYRREETPMRPVSPYGCAKLCAFNLAKVYRDSYNLFICNGILFNHESPRRGETFVTNKIVNGAVRIKKGLDKRLSLGNLDAARDWGHAKDYVLAMWLMLQHPHPDDYVCATGVSHTIRELCDLVFGKLGMVYEEYVGMDAKYFRPNELHVLKGDCSKLKNVLGWNPEYSFEDMITEMIQEAEN